MRYLEITFQTRVGQELGKFLPHQFHYSHNNRQNRLLNRDATNLTREAE